MNQEIVDFERVDEIDAEAIGEPGQRLFRIRARKGPYTASLWLEKQQLQALCIAIRQELEERLEEEPEDIPQLPIGDFPEHATIDFRIGRLALGWNDAKDEFVIQAQPLEPGNNAPTIFRCQADMAQATAFCDLAEVVLAAGRPICLLCGEPINPTGHVCVRANGHLKQEIPPPDSGRDL